MINKAPKFISGDREIYDKFIKKHVVGMGNSIVYQTEDAEGNIQCVKEIRLQDKQAEFIFRKEIELLIKIKNNPHPAIVEYKGCYTLQVKDKNDKKGYIEMEKGITNLKTYLTQRTSYFEQEDIIFFMSTMIEVFAHLQRSEVAHRDIKPSNIILFSEEPLYFKVCDVGAGIAVGFCDYTKEMTVIGTPYYLSPELYRAHNKRLHIVNYKAYKSDTYSLGLLFLEFCSLKRLENRLEHQPSRIEELILHIKTIYPNIIGLGKILRKMLDEEVSERMDFIELEKFIAENNLLRNKIDNTITLDPKMYEKISEKNEICIDKIENLHQLQALVSTDSKFERLVIKIQSSIKSQKFLGEKDHLEDLINIKYMRLSELIVQLEMSAMNDKHAKLLAEALEKNKGLKVLNLNFWNNQIGNEGFIALLRSIQNNLNELEELTLNIASNQVRITANFEQFMDLSQFVNMRVLDLNLGFNDIQTDYLPQIMKSISACENLQSLDLNLESIRTNHVHFSKAMKQLYKLKGVQYLTINASCNSIREEGVYALADICLNLNKLISCKFILRNSEITDKGFYEFMKTLTTKTQLKELKLNLLRNQLTEKGIKNGFAFIENLNCLETFDLNISNNELSDFSFKYLSNSILAIKSLIKLRLVFDTCSLTEKGCLYIGRIISQQPELEELDISLRYNDIKMEGVQYICAGLIQVKKIKRIKVNLEGTQVGDYAANYLASCLLKLRKLTSVDLNLQNCNLSSETMSNIVKTVHECCQKTEEITIDMRKNQQIKKQLYEQIKKELENSRVAIKVDQPGNNFMKAEQPAGSFITS